MWPKSTFDGVRAAIASRKVVSGSIEFQFRRVSDETKIGSQTYELTLTRPIGVQVEGKLIPVHFPPPSILCIKF